jgi:hypothetical protein
MKHRVAVVRGMSYCNRATDRTPDCSRREQSSGKIARIGFSNTCILLDADVHDSLAPMSHRAQERTDKAGLPESPSRSHSACDILVYQEGNP